MAGLTLSSTVPATNSGPQGLVFTCGSQYKMLFMLSINRISGIWPSPGLKLCGDYGAATVRQLCPHCASLSPLETSPRSGAYPQ